MMKRVKVVVKKMMILMLMMTLMSDCTNALGSMQPARVSAHIEGAGLD